MKRRFLRLLAGLTIPAFCLLTSPKALAAGRSNATELPTGQSIGFSVQSGAADPGSPHLTLSGTTGEKNVVLSMQSGVLEPDAGCLSLSLRMPASKHALSHEVLERSERLWGGRIDRGVVKDTLFLYTVEVDGETVLDRVGSGCIEENYYVRTSDLSDISVSGRCRRAPNWKELEESELEEPVGEGANLRLRGYLVKKDIKLYLCREITVTDKDGNVVYYDLDQQPATKDEHYSFLVTTGGSSGAKGGPQTLEREWTYVSSDGRELWKVDLLGTFQDGHCLEASGFAQAISDDWLMEDSEFLAMDTEAIAHVTVSRRVLGFVVARETYEFHLTTQ